MASDFEVQYFNDWKTINSVCLSFFFSNLFSSEAFLFNHPFEKIKMTKLAHILALWSDQKYSVKVRISQYSTDLLPQASF